MNLNIHIGKLKLKNPVVCASGTFGFDENLKGIVNFNKIGAITTKTVTLKPRQGNPPPRIFETSCGVINSVGLDNPGIEAFIKVNIPRLAKLNTKFIVSIGGFSKSDYTRAVEKLDKIKTLEAFEINLSCPNLKMKKMISQNPQATYRLIKAIRGLTQKTIIAKLTPEVTDIVSVAKAAKDAGADGLSLINTFYAMAIDVCSRRPYLGNIYGGYSGKAIKPLGIYRVWRVAKSVKNIPIIAGGGIQGPVCALEYILAGASAVSLGTVNMVYPNTSQSVVEGIIKYLNRHKIKDINELRGSLKC
ncbi:MAG: dihydroorotate dehydrogenase [Candidatus Omnitrophota bacterium]